MSRLQPRIPQTSAVGVCQRQPPIYTPQLFCAPKGKETHTQGKAQTKESKLINNCYGAFHRVPDGDRAVKYPDSILHFPKPHCTNNHPTEKSVDLCRWLVRTYSKTGDIILDATMGSGTTGVAAILEGRNFVGIEKEEKHFADAQKRILQAQNHFKQGLLFAQ